MTEEQQLLDEWCLVELMGHRRVAARVSEATIAGAGFLRLDEPAVNGTPGRTQFVAPGSVYALHPTTEAVVTAMAAKWRTDPVQRWELPAAPLQPRMDESDYSDDEEEDNQPDPF